MRSRKNDHVRLRGRSPPAEGPAAGAGVVEAVGGRGHSRGRARLREAPFVVWVALTWVGRWPPVVRRDSSRRSPTRKHKDAILNTH